MLRFMVRSRTHAIATAVLCMLVPLFSFVSGGIVGLAALRYGLADGALVLAVTTAVSTLAMWLLHETYLPVVIFVLFTGLPVLGLAWVLRRTASQGAALAAAGAMTAAVLAAIHLLAADPMAWWRAQLERFFAQPIRDANPELAPEGLELVDAIVDAMSVPAAVVVSLMLIAMLILWLARWMHAALDNPGGFGKEFRALRLDRRVAYAGLALALLAVLAGHFAGGLFRGLFALVFNMYTIQGIALAHAVVHQRGASTGWLVAMYAGMLLMAPLATLGLALAGFSDTWFDFRRRWGAGT